MDDEALQPLVQRIVDAVTRTGDEQKLQALGNVLGEAAGDRPRRIDESVMIVQTLDSLQAVHVRVMQLLDNEPENVPDDHAKVWTIPLVEQNLPDVSTVGAQGALGGLVSQGLVLMSTGFGGGIVFVLSEYGRAMLAVLR